MQLIIFVLAAFGLGFWFSRSRAADDLTRRLRRNPGSKAENAPSQAEASTDK